MGVAGVAGSNAAAPGSRVETAAKGSKMNNLKKIIFCAQIFKLFKQRETQ
jgi:hypothetical protein